MNKLLALPICAMMATAIVCLYSCGHDDGKAESVIPVNINPDKLIVEQINMNDMLELETNDSSLIYDICAMEKIGNILYVNSRSFIREFSADSGKYIGNLAKVGQGPGEYTFVSRFWSDNATLHIWDNNEKRVFNYLSDGTFISNYEPFHNGNEVTSIPQFFIQDDDEYLTINTYNGGTEETNPRYSFYDRNMNFICDVPGRDMRNGSFLPDRAFYDSNRKRVLVWEALKDTLFTVSKEGVIPLYAFSFGDQSFPQEKQALPDYYDRKDEFMNMSPQKAISFLRCFQTYGKYLYFTCISNDYVNYLVQLNTDDNKADIFHYEKDGTGLNQQSFFKIIDNTLYLSFTDTLNTEKNPSLYRIQLPITKQ